MKKPMRILVLHGINLNMFGKREASVYGTTTLAEIDAALRQLAQELETEVDCFQTNSEEAICERIHRVVIRKGFRRRDDQRRRVDALQLRTA